MAFEHDRVLAHAEVVVRAPHRDLDGPVRPVPGRAGEVPAVSLEVGEDPIASFGVQPREGVGEGLLVSMVAARAPGPGTASIIREP